MPCPWQYAQSIPELRGPNWARWWSLRTENIRSRQLPAIQIAKDRRPWHLAATFPNLDFLCQFSAILAIFLGKVLSCCARIYNIWALQGAPMPLSLSGRAARTVQSEIRAMSIACEKVKGINLA